MANPPLLYEPEEAAAKAAAEATKEAEVAAARPELFDAVVSLDPQVRTRCTKRDALHCMHMHCMHCVGLANPRPNALFMAFNSMPP